MSFKHLAFAALASVLVPTFAGVAHADYEQAESAAAKNDYSAARKALEPLSQGTDSRVFRLLGELNRDGKGEPVDLREAYKDFSLAFMYTTDPDDRAEQLALRRKVARELSHEDIVAGEQRVVVWLKARLGPDELKLQIGELKSALKACKSQCEKQAERVLQYGPAASDLIPELQSLMTRDPMWMPREWYAFALAAIGTEGVPALTSHFSDRKEMLSEGFWNAGQVITMLSLLGPTAFAAKKPLLEALSASYAGAGGESERFFSELSGGTGEDLLIQVKSGMANAIVAITDPEREIYDGLLAYIGVEKNPRIRLMAAWAVGLTYREPEIGLNLAETYLKSNDPKIQTTALAVIADFDDALMAHERIQSLLPALRDVAEAGIGDARFSARKVLDNMMRSEIEAASKLMEDKDYPAVIKKMSSALAFNPWSEVSLRIRAQAKRELGDMDGAIADYTKALDYSETSYWLQFALESAGMLKGEVTGEFDLSTREALPRCVRDANCYEALKQF